MNLPSHPEPKSFPLIPAEFLGDILFIWNFFATYNKFLGKLNLTQEKIYLALEYGGSEPVELVHEMHLQLLNYIYKDILQVQSIDSLKELQENSFFTITKYLFEGELLEDLMPYVWTEYIRNAYHIPEIAPMFEDKSVKADIEQLAQHGCLNYNALSLRVKINILRFLIDCLSESRSFHEKLAEKAEKLAGKQKQKSDLVQ